MGKHIIETPPEIDLSDFPAEVHQPVTPPEVDAAQLERVLMAVVWSSKLRNLRPTYEHVEEPPGESVRGHELADFLGIPTHVIATAVAERQFSRVSGVDVEGRKVEIGIYGVIDWIVSLGIPVTISDTTKEWANTVHALVARLKDDFREVNQLRARMQQLRGCISGMAADRDAEAAKVRVDRGDARHKRESELASKSAPPPWKVRMLARRAAAAVE